MELIWVLWFIYGLLSGVMAYAVVETELNRNRNRDPDVPDPSGESDGVDRYIPSPEEISEVLRYHRIGASHKEQAVIDYLIEEHGGEEE